MQKSSIINEKADERVYQWIDSEQGQASFMQLMVGDGISRNLTTL